MSVGWRVDGFCSALTLEPAFRRGLGVYGVKYTLRLTGTCPTFWVYGLRQ